MDNNEDNRPSGNKNKQKRGKYIKRQTPTNSRERPILPIFPRPALLRGQRPAPRPIATYPDFHHNEDLPGFLDPTSAQYCLEVKLHEFPRPLPNLLRYSPPRFIAPRPGNVRAREIGEPAPWVFPGFPQNYQFGYPPRPNPERNFYHEIQFSELGNRSHKCNPETPDLFQLIESLPPLMGPMPKKVLKGEMGQPLHQPPPPLMGPFPSNTQERRERYPIPRPSTVVAENRPRILNLDNRGFHRHSMNLHRSHHSLHRPFMRPTMLPVNFHGRNFSYRAQAPRPVVYEPTRVTREREEFSVLESEEVEEWLRKEVMNQELIIRQRLTIEWVNKLPTPPRQEDKEGSK